MCVNKAMVGWHTEKLGRICRERCGGATYLEINQVSQVIGGSHSGMTAEGDNKVLMQKVVKDILSHVRKGKHPMPKVTKETMGMLSISDSITSFESLKNLIYFREQFEIRTMGKTLERKIMKEGQEFFKVWMESLNEEIQSLATAFGERFFVENAIKMLAKAQKSKELLQATLYLHMYMVVHDNISFYLVNSVISPKAAQGLLDGKDAAVKAFLPHMNSAVDGLGLCMHENLWPPISRDYIAFNA